MTGALILRTGVGEPVPLTVTILVATGALPSHLWQRTETRVSVHIAMYR